MSKKILTFPHEKVTQLLDLLLSKDAFLDARLDQDQRQQLVTYLELLHKWNQAYNLSAIKEPEKMVVYHLMDSLATAPYFSDYEKVLDVGTGAGLPGIPLAIFFAKAEPQKKFYLLDSLGKRIQFLRQVVRQLGLTNVEVIYSRVEDYDAEQFPAITSRAFTALDNMTLVCEHLLAPNGLYLLLKAKLANEELKTMPETFTLVDNIELDVPGLSDSERYLVKISRK